MSNQSKDKKIISADDLLELKTKELEIRKHRAELELEKIEAFSKEQEARKLLDITKPTDGYAEKLKEKSLSLFENIKKKSNFLLNLNELNYVVPFYPKNLILIGAVSGEGKSTVAANIAYAQILQGKRVLIVTTEESSEDTLNRVASLLLNVRYGNLDRMEEIEYEKIVELQTKLHGRLTVIDDNYGILNGFDLPSTTSSIEGLYFILDSLIKKQAEGFIYDVIIFDYFQNFGESRQNPSAKTVDILTKCAARLDQFKNHYNAPIVLLSQLKNNPPDKEIPAKERLEWCKGIVNRATCFLEVRADRETYTTKWIVHKSRFNDLSKNIIVTGWSKGKYVPISAEFKDAVLSQKINNIKSNTTH